MNLSHLAVRRPIATIMGIMIVVFFGLLSLYRLPIDLMPDITYPTLTVVTTYSDAGPEEVERLITIPLERSLSIISGIETINSTSSRGTSSIRMSFAWGTDLDSAANDIRDRLDRAVRFLPESADHPQLRKFDVSAFPILILGASARDLDPAELRRIAEDEIGARLERIPGVAGVEVWGGQARQFQVKIDPLILEGLNLTLNHVERAIQEASRSYAFGEIERGDYEFQLRYPTALESLDDIGEVVIVNRGNNAIRLKDIAQIESGYEKETRRTRINGETGVRLSVRKQDGTNTVEVAENVKREIESINRLYPQFTLVTMIDTSSYIQKSIANITFSMMYGGSLAVFVILFFLREIRSTLIVSTAIPVSVIATFVPIYFSGLSLNLMTLGGLALGIGMMVDNSIVVQENISHIRRTTSLAWRESAARGASSVTAAIIASTLTTLVIFLPLFMAEGISGIMFQQMAYVVAFALMCSLLIALLLVPVFNASEKGKRQNHTTLPAWSRVLESLFNRLQRRYELLLDLALRHSFVVFAIIAVLFIIAFQLTNMMGREFMPAADESGVRINVEMGQGTKIEALDPHMLAIETRLAELIPEMKDYMTRTDLNGRGEFRISLVSPTQRQRSSEQVATDLRRELKLPAGVIVRTRADQGLFILRMGATGDSNQLEVVIRGHEIAALERWGDIIESELTKVPGITDVERGQFSTTAETHLLVNRERAMQLGVQVPDLMRVIQSALDGYEAALVRQRGEEIPIYLILTGSGTGVLDRIGNMPVASDGGHTVVLRELIELRQSEGPPLISRRNQQRFLSLLANTAGRDLGSIGADVEKLLDEVELPTMYTAAIESDYKEQQKAFRELIGMISLAILLVYMILAALYESLRAPLVVMFSVPMAFIGAIFALWGTGSTLNMQSMIGLMMLAGIVVNNAILIVDHAMELQAAGEEPRAAAVKSAMRRFRPVLMTTATTMLALLPLAIGMGEGGEAQAPMARAVIGGLCSSTLITLFVIPIVYRRIVGTVVSR
ncbi:efflux RND transporter permease subunit [Chrysiogenes arsenatis]|uniref:efflux RND transporter permease subunit n=1 Tax=Chrysiogenes arsenatis TaxID=309797 RepID=UPI0003FF9B03|nr:efflux RND transporter permease subunit [Chrysiogenes arsenatis]